MPGYDTKGVRYGTLDAVVDTLRSENDALKAENARLRKALDEKVPLYHPRRRRAEVRFAVSWLLHRARQMNDPHARQILNAAAYNLGQEGEPIPSIRNLEPRHD